MTVNLLRMSLSGAFFILMIILIRAVAANRLPRRLYLVLWGVALARLLLPVSFSLPAGILSDVRDRLPGPNPKAFEYYLELGISLLGSSESPEENVPSTADTGMSDLSDPRTADLLGAGTADLEDVGMDDLPGAGMTELPEAGMAELLEAGMAELLEAGMAELPDVDGSAIGTEDGTAPVISGEVYQTMPDSSARCVPVILWSAGIVWAVVAVSFAVCFLAAWIRCRREFRTSAPVQNDFTAAWLREHPLRRKIEIRRAAGLSTPLTYGIVRPIILLPENMDWENAQQMHYVLFHEYIHIRHFDSLWKGIAAAALCVHWFNPAVWLLYTLFNRDIELECDECVVRRFGPKRRKEYAKLLLQMEGERSGLAPLGSYFSKNLTEERIKAILKFRKKSAAALVLTVLLMTSEAVLVFAAPGGQSGEDFTDIAGEEGGFSHMPVHDLVEQTRSVAERVGKEKRRAMEKLDTVLEAYKAFFRGGRESKYKLFDLDSDGIPEMIVRFLNERTNNETYSVAAWHNGSKRWITWGLFPPNVITDADKFDLEVDLQSDRPLIRISASGEDDHCMEEGNLFYTVENGEISMVFCSVYFLDKDSGEEKIFYKVDSVHDITKEEYDSYADTYHIPPEYYHMIETCDMDEIKQTDWFEKMDDAISAYKSLLD